MKQSHRLLIVGQGIQGKKRLRLLKSNGYTKVTTVDPVVNADYRDLSNLDIKGFTHAFVCTPESQKFDVIKKLLGIPKLLVEKPLLAILKDDSLRKIYNLAEGQRTQIYTAYNHRFEENLKYLKKQLQQDILGKIYLINLEYSNGTAQHINQTNWRNNSGGVVEDLLPHLFFIFKYLFPKLKPKFIQAISNSHETKCFDWTQVSLRANFTNINMTSSYLSWKNTFKVEIVGSLGTFKLSSLPKWFNSTFYFEKRKFPSGKPSEISKSFPQGDDSFLKEHHMFLEEYDHSNKEDYELNKFINFFISTILRETIVI